MVQHNRQGDMTSFIWICRWPSRPSSFNFLPLQKISILKSRYHSDPRFWPLMFFWSMVCYTGFQVADTACCGVGTYRGAFPCMNTTMMCDTPETYVWWDLYHPSHLANRVIADSVWNTPDDSPDFSLKSFHTLANLWPTNTQKDYSGDDYVSGSSSRASSSVCYGSGLNCPYNCVFSIWQLASPAGLQILFLLHSLVSLQRQISL